MAEGLRAVDVLGAAIEDRLEDMTAEIEELRTQIQVAEARITDLQRSLDIRMGQVPAKIEDIPRFLT